MKIIRDANPNGYSGYEAQKRVVGAAAPQTIEEQVVKKVEVPSEGNAGEEVGEEK